MGLGVEVKNVHGLSHVWDRCVGKEMSVVFLWGGGNWGLCAGSLRGRQALWTLALIADANADRVAMSGCGLAGFAVDAKSMKVMLRKRLVW